MTLDMKGGAFEIEDSNSLWQGKICSIYMRLILLGNGTKKFSKKQKILVYYVLVRHLMKPQLIF